MITAVCSGLKFHSLMNNKWPSADQAFRTMKYPVTLFFLGFGAEIVLTNVRNRVLLKWMV